MPDNGGPFVSAWVIVNISIPMNVIFGVLFPL